MKRKQLNFISEKHRSAFGGSLLEGKRKSRRPIATRSEMHLIIKAKSPVFAKNLKSFRESLELTAKKYFVHLIEFQFNGNHVHVLVRFFSRESYLNFIRRLTAQFARICGHAGIFKFRPYTRIVNGRKDRRNVLNYIFLNELESDGIGKRDGRKLADALAPPLPF